jgi:hypothetical protein
LTERRSKSLTPTLLQQRRREISPSVEHLRIQSSPLSTPRSLEDFEHGDRDRHRLLGRDANLRKTDPGLVRLRRHQ